MKLTWNGTARCVYVFWVLLNVPKHCISAVEGSIAHLVLLGCQVARAACATGDYKLVYQP